MSFTDEGVDPDSDSGWRNPILRSGTLLVACGSLKDPNFESTIVLLCQYGSEGGYGLVLNRPAHMPLIELFDHPPPSALVTGKNRRVYIGGPVEPADLQVLQIDMEGASGSFEVAPGIHLGGAWSGLEEILSRDPRNIRLFLGYSGWGAGQLEHEVTLGAWEVYQVDLQKLLLGPEEAWFGGPQDLKRFLNSL